MTPVAEKKQTWHAALEQRPQGGPRWLQDLRERGAALTAAQSVLDMLVQSDGTVVKVFPAVSSTWADASIADLRTQGAFVVDAARAGGSTDWIRIRSEAGCLVWIAPDG